MTADQIIRELEQIQHAPEQNSSTAPRSQPIRTLAAHATAVANVNWTEIIVDEISKHCSAHYDEGQASWGSQWQGQPLYHAWREIAQIDRNVEVLGLTNMRGLVAGLPAEPEAALVDLLNRMQVPFSLWSTVLLCQAYSIPGWSAWAKYQDQYGNSTNQGKALSSLLAMRLAYDFAVGQTLGLQIEWRSFLRQGRASFHSEDQGTLKEAWMRNVLLHASEIHYRQHLLGSLASAGSQAKQGTKQTAQAQMVFCIDVRSERMRRNIESVTSNVETFGFAGFFGIPMEYMPLGESQATAQLPVLLKPQFCIHECLNHGSDDDQSQAIDRRINVRSWRKLWQTFKSSSIGSFGFVESSGLLAGLQMVRQMFGLARPAKHHLDGLSSGVQCLKPEVRAHEVQHQVDVAVRVLSNLGLKKDFARLVVFCGHLSQTNNNPLGAGLDCGACGGHAGAPNARWLAQVLNSTDVRLGLCEQGIVIPPDTHFLAATHNTTTDEITFFEQADIPQSHQQDFEALVTTCHTARQATVHERLPHLAAQKSSDVMRRALDWSEVRPEWGLAGNAAFIVGPRSLTSSVDLNGKTFLHSYEHQNDPDGTILETIMTAPMIVANWINMQYYASAVDNAHFGSGSKAIHNVVGKFGILAGNAGDLQTGLPLQSLHDGTDFRHQPLRLLVVIQAPRASIERVYEKHEIVANLVNNHWLSLVALDEEGYFKLGSDGSWDRLTKIE